MWQLLPADQNFEMSDFGSTGDVIPLPVQKLTEFLLHAADNNLPYAFLFNHLIK